MCKLLLHNARMRLRSRDRLSWLPYVLPLLLFLLMTPAEKLFGVQAYPFIYTIKIAVIAAVLYVFWKFYPELKPNRKGVLLSLAAGPLLTFLWLIIDLYTPHFKIFGSRESYDPFVHITSTPLTWLFIVIRVFGLITVAPIIEELFYRAFLLRWVTNQDRFLKLSLGTYDATAFVAVVVIMAVSHPEYLAAAVFSALMNLLLNRTGNLWATITAHASTNFFLAIYVLCFHAWKYW
jgi:uncharacterized protein